MTELTPTQQDILQLKQSADTLILAHYYQSAEVKAIADFVGSTLAMAKLALEARQQNMLICGVSFMAETVKLIAPEKRVLLPSADAVCPMAGMITPQQVMELRGRYPTAAVVSYINSSAAVKSVSDACCTAASAVRIISQLPNRRIVFIPDMNVGAYAAEKCPDKAIILHDGFCPVHGAMTLQDALEAKAQHPDAVLLAHPECPPEVTAQADFVGGTLQIIEAVGRIDAPEYIVGTEFGVIEQLIERYPDKQFYSMSRSSLCLTMRRTTPELVLSCLKGGGIEVTLSADEEEGCLKAMGQMARY